jgi:hypothetical protein
MPETADFSRERREALLEPSLASGVPAVSLYSERAGFVVSMLGGPLAALAMGWLNARLLKRLSKDAWLLAALGALSVVLFVSLASAMSQGMDDIQWLGLRLGRRDVRLVSQAVGLLGYLAIYARHRRFHRAMQFADVQPRKAWIAGLLVLLGSGAVQWALLLALVFAVR